MRPSERAARPEAFGSEQGHHGAQGRPESPSPSLTGSFVYDDEGDDDQDVEGYERDSDRGSVAGHFVRETAPSGAQPASAQVPPPKPKRTRQLTTPHQSAVLHALLAQVRAAETFLCNLVLTGV